MAKVEVKKTYSLPVSKFWLNKSYYYIAEPLNTKSVSVFAAHANMSLSTGSSWQRLAMQMNTDQAHIVLISHIPYEVLHTQTKQTCTTILMQLICLSCCQAGCTPEVFFSMPGKKTVIK